MIDAPLSRKHLTTAQLQTFSINLRNSEPEQGRTQDNHNLDDIGSQSTGSVVSSAARLVLWYEYKIWSIVIGSGDQHSATERTSSECEDKIPWESFPYYWFLVQRGKFDTFVVLCYAVII